MNNVLICNICRNDYKHLGSHIWHKHKIKSRDYKKMFGLDYNHALISDEIKIKKQEHFKKHRQKYLKNLNNGNKYRFVKGVVNRVYFSNESIDRFINQLEDIENQMPLICPFCSVKYKKLQQHLNTKHKLKIVRIE